MSEPKCVSFATFHRDRLLRFMFSEYELSDIRTKFFTSYVCSLLHVSNTVLKIFFFNRNPTNLLIFSIYKFELILPSHWLSHLRYFQTLQNKTKQEINKNFEYIIYFPLSWRLSHVLFKTQRWKHHKFKFDPFIILSLMGTFLHFSTWNSNDVFFICNMCPPPVSLCWNVCHWNMRYLSGNSGDV